MKRIKQLTAIGLSACMLLGTSNVSYAMNVSLESAYQTFLSSSAELDIIEEKAYEASTQVITGQKDGFSYSVSNDSITILSYSGTDEDVVVPAEINGFPVKKIAYGAFKSLPNVKKLTFSEGIENISSSFAYGCQNLETIYIPSTAYLEENAFSGFVNFCCNIKQVIVAEGNPYLCVEEDILYDINKNSLIFYPGAIENEKLIVPDSVESISADAFADHTHIKEVVLPDTVTDIGGWAFNNSSLEKINIPSGCKMIGSYAFQNAKLKELFIPSEFDGVMGGNVFSDCPIGKIEVEEGNDKYYVCDNALICNDYLICFANTSDTKECVIPDTVTYICHGAFSNAKNLKHISIPDGVFAIEYFTFAGCSNLENIEIPKSVIRIGMNAFQGCESLKNITIPRGVEEIKNSTFADCKSLVSIEIPETVTSIEGWAFQGCESLKEITLPEKITKIDTCTFSACSSLENIEIPENVNYIGDSAFSGCLKLTSVTIPWQVNNIGTSAFSGCSSLRNVILPYGINEIKDHAFYACESLETVLIPETVTSIGMFAFAECTDLTSIIIPSKVTRIGRYAWNQCTNLASVVMPSSVISIEECAFQSCNKITDVYYTGTEENWNTIEISSNNNYMLTDAVIYYNYELSHAHNYIPKVIEPTCAKKGYTEYKCNVCGESYQTDETEAENHHYGEWKTVKEADCIGEGIQSRSCVVCGEKENEVISATGHEYTVTEIAPTCTEKGYIEHKCDMCGDSYQTEETEAKGHIYDDGKVTKEATYTDTGVCTYICQSCGTVKNESIPILVHTDISLKAIELEQRQYIYTGKSQKPAVTVMDTNGKTVDKANYTVTYSNNKKVGQATVTVTGKGDYTGTVTATFNILPKGTTLSKVTAKKKAFIVKWKKQTKETTGYQIQYSTTKKFKGAKTTTIKKNKTTSTTIKSLKAKKKYYVRVRTYKKVKINGKSTNLYSKWSKAKNVKTKK